MKDIMSLLFDTNAFKVCEENKPFWYTSGKIGPYFINTHFLYGSQEDAEDFLNFIDRELELHDKQDIPTELFNYVNDQYYSNEIYRTVVDALVELINKQIDVDAIDYISGGERRDWYFSMIVANLLGKPHITIYKDLTTVVSTCDFEENTEVNSLENKAVLHVADLLNQASSFERAWSPAINKLGSSIKWSVVVVNRNQGGDEVLYKHNIRSISLFKINDEFFLKARELGKISEAQLEMLKNYVIDPERSMRNFLLDHPEFLENSLKGDEKSKKRAKLCLDSDIYQLNK